MDDDDIIDQYLAHGYRGRSINNPFPPIRDCKEHLISCIKNGFLAGVVLNTFIFFSSPSLSEYVSKPIIIKSYIIRSLKVGILFSVILGTSGIIWCGMDKDEQTKQQEFKNLNKQPQPQSTPPTLKPTSKSNKNKKENCNIIEFNNRINKFK